jgi:hypothetical protein
LTPNVSHPLLSPPFFPIPDIASKISREEMFENDSFLALIYETNHSWLK